MRLAPGTLVVLLALAPMMAQETRPASRPAGEVDAHTWQEWVEGLAPKAAADPFTQAEYAVSTAGFTAARLADCGAGPAYQVKGEKPSLLQTVPYMVAGFDRKQTYVAAVGGSKPVCVWYGEGFGVRGVESLDASGPIRSYRGDASSEKVEIPKPVSLDELGVIGKIIKDAGGRLEKPPPFDVKDHVVFALPYNNADHPEAVPRFARALRSRGARAVLFVEGEGASKTSAPPSITRKDKFRRPAREDPPALFLTSEAARSLNWAGTVKVAVTYRAREISIPNVVGQIGPDSGECVLLCCNAEGAGHATAVVLAAAKLLSASSDSLRRPIVVAITSKPDLEIGGQDWLLAHTPVPVSRIVAAVHVDGADACGGAQVPKSVEILQSGRPCPELTTSALDALGRNGFPGNTAKECPAAQRFVDAYVNRGIPAIALRVTPGSFDDGLSAARVAAALTRALADREFRPVLPTR